MGGPGSGRRKEWWYVSDCRVLVIGELTAHGRRESQPTAEVRWRRGGVTQARLTYAITHEQRLEGDQWVLAMSYRKTMDAPEDRLRIGLETDKRDLALCPHCVRPVRKLYALPEGRYFKCRRCNGLGYQRPRRQPSLQPDIRAALGSLLEGLRDKPTRADRRVKAKRALLESLAAEVDDLRPQERRIYCLRLSKAGYSCREIARFVHCSKSSVQRYLAAGSAAIDYRVLALERLQRYYQTHPPSLREMRAWGRQTRAAEPEPEEMVLTFGEPQADGSPVPR